MITVTGLTGDRFFINNPIFINIQSPEERVVMTIIGSDVRFTFPMYNGSSTDIDLSEIVKGLMEEPRNNTPPFNGEVMKGVSITLEFQLFDGVSVTTINRTFIRGGEQSNKSNLNTPSGFVLKESDLIPVWSGYNNGKFTINSSGEIVFNSLLSEGEIDRRRVVGCNPLFFRFLNTKGGYSYWLFERWQRTNKSKQTERVKRKGYYLDLGMISENGLQVTSRVEREYLKTMDALILSPEIYVLNLLDHDLSSISTDQWARVYNAGNSKVWDDAESLYEYSFNFDILLEYNARVKW